MGIQKVACSFMVVNCFALLWFWIRGAVWRYKFGLVRNFPPRSKFGTMSIVLPCYMPNEHSIVMETIEHLLNVVEYENDENSLEEEPTVTVYCTYNAPPTWSHPVEQQLAKMDNTRVGKWRRRFRAIRVHDSKSKAANLNRVIEEIDTDYCVIYDADHHPDFDSLRIMTNQLIIEDADCIQGSTYIREGLGFMGLMIDAEFFMNFFLLLPAASTIVSGGWFGGSNAVWRTPFLKSQPFHPSVQTEDIEYTARALMKQAKMNFCPQSRSGELAPASLAAFWKQRLRWAMGWDQVTLMHFAGITTGGSLTLRLRLGMFWLLVMRWVVAVFMAYAVVIHPVVKMVSHIHAWASGQGEDLQPSSYEMFDKISGCCLVITLSILLITVIVYERPLRTKMRQLLFVCLFIAFSPFNLLFQIYLTAVSLRRIWRGEIGGWVVTARAGGGSGGDPHDAESSSHPQARASIACLMGSRFQFADDADGTYHVMKADPKRRRTTVAGSASKWSAIELQNRRQTA
eukprot:TRINITY_DN11745_c0_g1_i2.p1 TRINITY_DN11745_c0_g1~~TRINITY_DN11745_c0_g1_i2.p1  ORF type:complete len:513 (-),score=50.63 TRINITY_DN11745_c0_g1_i2:165-1703(-)